MSNLFLLKKVNTKLFFVIFSMSFFVGCSDLDYVNVVNDDVVVSINLNVDSIIENSVDIHDDIQEEYSLDIPTENFGLTPSNVRLWLEDNYSNRLWYLDYRLFDIDKLSYYHEFINFENSTFKIIFTTENKVRDFKFLEIRWNENFFNDNKNGSERRYNIIEILYSLDELVPEIPLIVVGPDFGSALSANGFSYVDEYGTTLYFEFFQSGKTGLIEIVEF